jgi:UDP-N-acetylmuramate-alanine ligase
LTHHVARAVRHGDVVFTLGAGDITRVGPELLEILKAGNGKRGAVA